MSRSFADDLLADFAAEAVERLDHLEELLLTLPRAEPAERPAILSGIRLELHTLKGNAGMMGLAEQQRLAHDLEDSVDSLEDPTGGDPGDPGEPDVQPLLAGVDRFRALLTETSRQAAGAPTRTESDGAAAVPAGEISSSVRIPFSTLDGLVDQLAEVVIVRNRLADALTGLRPHLPRRVGSTELTPLNAAWEQLSQAHDRLGTILDQLQGSVLNLRMVPLSTLFRHLSRIVHDTSAEEGKEIHFETAGADTPLDKALIELASEALGHLVRNAVIHGIEAPDVRRRAGKPAAGTLRLDAVASPREVRIDILDDGGGVDRREVLAAAERHGHDLREGEDPLELLFLSGFSTREAWPPARAPGPSSASTCRSPPRSPAPSSCAATARTMPCRSARWSRACASRPSGSTR
jgi:two-component system chemotaxis sensor kinase CheA